MTQLAMSGFEARPSSRSVASSSSYGRLLSKPTVCLRLRPTHCRRAARSTPDRPTRCGARRPTDAARAGGRGRPRPRDRRRCAMGRRIVDGALVRGPPPHRRKGCRARSRAGATSRSFGAAAHLQLRLSGLDDDDARTLVAGRAKSRPAADRVVQVAAGIPLALLELPDVVGAFPPTGGVETGSGRTACQRGVPGRRLDDLTESTRLAVAVVAADGRVPILRENLANNAFGRRWTSRGRAASRPRRRNRDDRAIGSHSAARSCVRFAYHGLDRPERRRVLTPRSPVCSTDLVTPRAERPRGTRRRRGPRTRRGRRPGSRQDGPRRLERRRVADDRRRIQADRKPGRRDDDQARRLLAGAVALLAAGHWDLALDQLRRGRCVRDRTSTAADITRHRPERLRGVPRRPRERRADPGRAADVIESLDPGRATRLALRAR